MASFKALTPATCASLAFSSFHCNTVQNKITGSKILPGRKAKSSVYFVCRARVILSPRSTGHTPQTQAAHCWHPTQIPSSVRPFAPRLRNWGGLGRTEAADRVLAPLSSAHADTRRGSRPAVLLGRSAPGFPPSSSACPTATARRRQAQPGSLARGRAATGARMAGRRRSPGPVAAAPPAGRKAQSGPAEEAVTLPPPPPRRSAAPLFPPPSLPPGRTLVTVLAEPVLEAAAPEPLPSAWRVPPADAAAPAAFEAALEAPEAAAAPRLLFSFRFFLSRLAKKSSRLLSSVSAMAAAPVGGGRALSAAAPDGGAGRGRRGQLRPGPTGEPRAAASRGARARPLNGCGRPGPREPARLPAGGGSRAPRWWPPLDTARKRGGKGREREGRRRPRRGDGLRRSGAEPAGCTPLQRMRRGAPANERPGKKCPPASQKSAGTRR